jgi:hypothetical protein
MFRIWLLALADVAIGIAAYRLSDKNLVITFITVLHPILLQVAGYRGGKRGVMAVAAHLAALHFGWWYARWWGLLFSSLPAILFFWVGLISLSLFALPVQVREWDEAARCLIGYVTGYHYAYHRVRGEETEEVQGGKLMRRGLNPGLILSNAYSAVPISTGIGFSCVAGPGVTFIGRAERPHLKQVLDLRLQARGAKVRAATRDGIDVEFFLLTLFGIETAPPARPPVTTTPYSESAVFNAIIAQRSGTDKELRWDEIPLELGKNIARTVIAGYLLDRLLEDETQAEQQAREATEPATIAERRLRLDKKHSEKMPRDYVRDEIEKRLRAEIAGYTVNEDGTQQADPVRKFYGIKIIGVGLGNLEIAGAKDEDRKKAAERPETKEVLEAKERVKQADDLREKILAQRVMSWQAEWLGESVRRRAQSEAEAAREIGRARAQSQMRMIQALTEGFEQAKELGLTVRTDMVVLLRLLDAMEEMVREPGTREHVPEEVVHTQAILKRAAQRAAGH